ncbi:MAG: MFS transporter, partial [Chloroflexi bacterium]|nr:MFS transporter [Chloroflexota bacterium]
MSTDVSAAEAPASDTAAPEQARAHASGQWLSYLGWSFSIGVFSAFNNFTLTLWLTSFTSSYLLLGLLGNSRSFEGALVSPLVGAWSDRTWAGWLGRRRPFILVGGLLSALLFALTPAISRWAVPSAVGPLSGELAGLIPTIVAIFLFTLTFNAADDVHRALLADVTAPSERNQLSAWSTVVNMAGQVGILVLGFVLWHDGVPDAAFTITGLLVAIGALVTVVGVREPPPAVWDREGHVDGEEAGPRADDEEGGWRSASGSLLTRYRGAT